MINITQEDYIGLGSFIKERRKVLGMCRREFSKKMQVPINTIDRWEKEDLDNIGLKEIKQLGKILNYYPLIFINGLPEEAYLDWDNFIKQEFINC